MRGARRAVRTRFAEDILFSQRVKGDTMFVVMDS
jgi:hypothetical protein